MINDALKEFHDHKDSIISAGVQTGKGSDVLNNVLVVVKIKIN